MRAVEGWVVVNSGGWPLLETLRAQRYRAQEAYDHIHGPGSFKTDRKLKSVELVFCALAPVKPAPAPPSPTSPEVQ